MCRAVKCDVCGKTTWAGCGQHVDALKASVAASQWCNGQHSQQEIDEAKAQNPCFFARLFNR
jgi:hypothetical protein